MDIKSILIPVDFSHGSQNALRYGLNLAEKFGAEIIVLHVINKNYLATLMYISAISDEETKKKLWLKHKDELRLFLKKNHALDKVTFLTCEGLPFQEIARKAKELAVDLVIMGGYGQTGQENLEHIFFGSTAEKVVRLLPCPVLCVP
jgi:nucleotide-binding universal stress UspA family protein